MDEKEMFEVFYGKDTKEVYNKFKAIEASVSNSDELYNSFDLIAKMLVDDKSYIRLRSFRIICASSKYDKENKINEILDDLLKLLDDDLPTIVRQYLKALNTLLLYKPELSLKVEQKLKEINYLKYKDSMSPLIKKDIDYILNYM